jgi:protein CsiD
MNSILPNAPVEAKSSAFFALQPHPVHPRLRHVALDPAAVQAFLRSSADVDIQNLEYVPYVRHMLAGRLEACAGPGLCKALNGLARDRRWGGFTLGMADASADPADFVRFGTAVAHLLGPANHDLMSGKYYARFTVKDTDESDSYLRQAYRLFTLHTDGTFVSEATEWLLMMKFREENATCGESRLLHIDDWEERDRFQQHPFGNRPFRYKAPGSKNVDEDVERPVFFESQFGHSISFIDQFVQPRSRAEATYLHDLSASLDASKGTREVPLPTGQLVVVNNYFWLHGRAPFLKHPALNRELMRQRGMFENEGLPR